MIHITDNTGNIILGAMALLLSVVSLGFDQYPQFPSMCIILWMILMIIIKTLEPIPTETRHDWHQIWREIQEKKTSPVRAFLYLHAKLIFPTLFTIYLILLIIEKVKIVPDNWHYFASSSIQTLQLLWVTLGSAVLANFTWFPDNAYEVEHRSPTKNMLTILFICGLAYMGMWAIFEEIKIIGRVSYFVSLSVWILIALVSCMILTEEEQKEKQNNKNLQNNSPLHD